jgi:hypothetical protein
MQTQRAALTAETARVEAAAGPLQYLAVMVGTDETAVRWLILLMVLPAPQSRCAVLQTLSSTGCTVAT